MNSSPKPEAAVAVLKLHAKSFSWGGFFLPRKRLHQAARLYRFCRYCDDIADESNGHQEAQILLLNIDEDLAKGSSDISFVQDFLDLASSTGMNMQYARDLLQGLIQDIRGASFQSRKDLDHYCYQVAGTVGGLMCPILGVKDPVALDYAIRLGQAMQLTNICRDVREDALNGRIYLPLEMLEERGIKPEQLFNLTASNQNLAKVIDELLVRADGYYKKGEEGLSFIPWWNRLAIFVASRLYRHIGVKIRQTGLRPLKGRSFLTRSEKFRLVAQSFIRFFHPRLWMRP